MRKVRFNLFIPHVVGIKDTGKFQTDWPNYGTFHQWAAKYEDLGEFGAGNYIVALVENVDGFIEEVLPCNIKFIS